MRNLYCQLHSLLVQLAGAMQCQFQRKCSTYGAEDYVAV